MKWAHMAYVDSKKFSRSAIIAASAGCKNTMFVIIKIKILIIWLVIASKPNRYLSFYALQCAILTAQWKGHDGSNIALELSKQFSFVKINLE